MKQLHIIKKSISYPGNIGFQEMVLFYRKADPQQIKQMEAYIEDGNWSKFKTLIKKVLNITLD